MFYEAVFQPSKRKNYNAEAKKLAGKKIAVQDGWMIEDGPLKGQNCFYIPNSTVGWIPMDDLIDLKPISFTKWKEIYKNLDLGNLS
ncbi:MAG: hypothetical protein JSV31_08380 [Desulfobacterales bacterium]|jgi:hypothetical protein|nr:MAG: hypothetical protein JSV31_08380 [Desulfobacterales bacterium]